MSYKITNSYWKGWRKIIIFKTTFWCKAFNDYLILWNRDKDIVKKIPSSILTLQEDDYFRVIKYKCKRRKVLKYNTEIKRLELINYIENIIKVINI